jgi:GT2 family glycosyltransferase
MNENIEISPKVFIITLNWNGKNDTIECIKSLKKLHYANYEVVVVDNGSTDGSAAAIKAQFPDITIIENGRNFGYSEGFNTGLKHACAHGADYFLILNNDTIIDPDALAELVKVAQEDERIGFVTGKVYWYTRRDVLQTAGRKNHPLTLVGRHVGSGEVDHGQYDRVQDYDFTDDVFLLVRRQAYETVGGYDPIFFLYGEEADWCARVRRAGFRIVYTPGAKIWHKGLVGNENLPISSKRIFYLERDGIPFIRRNASQEEWKAYLRHLLIRFPYMLLHYAKHGRFGAMLGYFIGVSYGMFLVWRHPVGFQRAVAHPNRVTASSTQPESISTLKGKGRKYTTNPGTK